MLRCIFLQIWRTYQAIKVNKTLMPIMYLPQWLCIYSSSPKSIKILTVQRCIVPPNLETLPWIGRDLLRGRGRNGANVDFKLDLALKVKVYSRIIK